MSPGLQSPCESQAGVAEGDMEFLSFLVLVFELIEHHGMHLCVFMHACSVDMAQN